MNTKTREAHLATDLRIMGAIVSKDVVDMVTNRTTLAGLLSLLFVVIFYRALPRLTADDSRPAVLAYDAGDSTLIPALENSGAVDLYTYPSQEKMERYLANGDVPELGLIIPPDFDRIVEGGGQPVLQGYVLHWVRAEDATELKQVVEGHVAELVGVPVAIQMDGNVVTMQPDSTGRGMTAGLAITFATLMVGVTLVPHLMLEEKRAKTLEVLLVSPAGPVHLTLAKAVVGLVYGIAILAVAFALNWALIVQWGLALATVLCGLLLAVALGLLLGMVIETRQQLILWGQVVVLPLFLPMFLSIMDDLMPEWLLSIFPWIPSVALFDTLRVSFSNQFDVRLIGPPLGLVLAYTAAILALVAWRVWRTDR